MMRRITDMLYIKMSYHTSVLNIIQTTMYNITITEDEHSSHYKL